MLMGDNFLVLSNDFMEKIETDGSKFDEFARAVELFKINITFSVGLQDCLLECNWAESSCGRCW